MASRWPGWTDQRRLVDLVFFGLGSAVIGAIVVAGGSVSIRGALASAVVGMLASTAILGVVFLAARRAAGSRPQTDRPNRPRGLLG